MFNLLLPNGTLGQEFSFLPMLGNIVLAAMIESGKNNDRELIARFKAGDPSALDEIVLRYQDRVYNLCRHMLGNLHDAEDAAQDTFVKAYQNLHKFRPDASLYTWLYRIAVNTCIDYKRKPFFESLFRRTEEGEELMLDRPSEEPSPERVYEAKQMDRALWQGLAKISPKLRAAIILKEVEGLSYEEIADVLDISLGTVKSRISRAREELLGIIKAI
jgi:RNA polymerase sigma-70 factor (ECF subfamily)